MMCKEIQFQLPDFVVEKLSEQERLIVVEHLRICKTCEAEAAELWLIVQEIGESNAWTPSEAYFDGLLPRIHERIDRKSSWAIPEWATKFVLPFGAAVIMVIALLRVSSTVENQPQDLQTILQQLQPEEIQQVADQQTLSEVSEPSTNDNDATTVSLDNDKEIVKELIKDDQVSSLYSEADVQSATENLNDQEIDRLVSYLQTKFDVN